MKFADFVFVLYTEKVVIFAAKMAFFTSRNTNVCKICKLQEAVSPNFTVQQLALAAKL